jgi:2-aminoadipate transaminase
MNLKLSKRAFKYKTDALKQIFEAIRKPGMISLAGGIPSADSFPQDIIKKITMDVLDTKQAQALQYNSTPGVTELRESIAFWMKDMHDLDVNTQNVMVTTGSTQALDLIAKAFLDDGDKIIVENPTYLGALWGFDPFFPEYLTVDSQEDGIDLDDLENVLKENSNVKLLYIVSTFQNPTGRTVSKEKRMRLCELADKYDFLIVEDNPYGYLRYKGEDVAPIAKFDNCGRVIYLSTFSKILAPGFRVAYVVASEEIIEWLCNVKESADLHTGVLDQYIVNEYIKEGHAKSQIEKIIKLYEPRYNAILEALDSKMQGKAKWTTPEGGMFVWLELDESIDTQELYQKAVENNVAFVPGVHFFAYKNIKNYLRLNFSNVDEERIGKGVKILSNLI